MNGSLSNVSQIHPGVPPRSHLSFLCGSRRLFRDRYAILRILGQGGFGVTFLARDVILPGEPLCVIKQLCPKVNDAAAMQLASRRFEQEARALSKLGSHTQIPQLLAYFELDSEFYLVQEYVRGLTLAKELQRFGPMPEGRVKQFLHEFLPLLKYVHSHKVIHRDIKPPNLIRRKEDGGLVLIDFGAVKERLRQAESSFRPTTTQFVGTVGFAPPEQLAARPVYSSDLYALGMTCLYLLSGKSPLDFDYEFATGQLDWQTEVPAISQHFGKILHKMLRIEPQERYKSVDEVQRALELEPYVLDLADCMTVHPKPALDKTAIAEPSSGYIPPIVREAMAIRDWQAKRQARRRR